jgi:hypothetical protein
MRQSLVRARCPTPPLDGLYRAAARATRTDDDALQMRVDAVSSSGRTGCKVRCPPRCAAFHCGKYDDRDHSPIYYLVDNFIPGLGRRMLGRMSGGGYANSAARFNGPWCPHTTVCMMGVPCGSSVAALAASSIRRGTFRRTLPSSPFLPVQI